MVPTDVNADTTVIIKIIPIIPAIEMVLFFSLSMFLIFLAIRPPIPARIMNVTTTTTKNNISSNILENKAINKGEYYSKINTISYFIFG